LKPTVKVWDLFVRVSHWLIVLLVASAWLSSEIGDAEFKWHSWNGYALFVLVLSRLIWGLVGSTTARYSDFLKAPKQAFIYLRDLHQGKEAKYLGHNPAGGWMALMLWLVLIAQAITGMFSSDDVIFDGPFSYYVSSATVSTITAAHHLLFNVLVLLVMFHVFAVLYHEYVKKEALIAAMITGNKQVSNARPNEKSNAKPDPKLAFRPFYFALFIVAVIAISFWIILKSYA